MATKKYGDVNSIGNSEEVTQLGFGTPEATVDNNTGIPSVTVSASGPDSAKVFKFDFKNIKGAKGDTGPQGLTGGQGPQGDTGAAAGFGTITASVDANVGTPSVTVSTSGTNTSKNFTFTFKNLKGEKGDTGPAGSTASVGNHASSATTYGKATSTLFGHVMLCNSYDGTATATGNYAVTPAALNYVYQLAFNANKTANSITPGTSLNAIQLSRLNGLCGVNTAASGSNNISIGYNTKSVSNNAIAIGFGSTANTNQGIAIGYNAMVLKNSSGHSGIAIGTDVTANSQNRHYSIAMGCSITSTVECIGIGGNITGTVSGAISLGLNIVNKGGYALAAGGNITVESGSIVIGEDISANCLGGIILAEKTTIDSGTFGIAIGYNSTINGSYNTAIGYGTSILAPAAGRSTAIGYNAQTTSTNTIQLGDSSGLSAIKSKVTSITSSSDERDKTDIEEISNATEFLRKIRAIRYHWNGRNAYEYQDSLDEETGKTIHNPLLTDDIREARKYGIIGYDKEAWLRGDKKGSRYRSGVSAQEVQKALMEVYGTDNYANLVNDNQYDYDPSEIPEGVESELGVNYTNFIPFLIRGFQEQQDEIDSLKERIAALEAVSV